MIEAEKYFSKYSHTFIFVKLGDILRTELIEKNYPIWFSNFDRSDHFLRIWQND